MTAEASCPICKGSMELTEQYKHHRGLAATVILLGIVSFFTINIVLGTLFLIIGLVMAFAKQEFWCCIACKSVVERVRRSSH